MKRGSFSDQACSAEGCDAPAERGGRCWRHLKQDQRGGLEHPEFGSRYESPLERLRAAALKYADAGDDEGDFRRADDQLRKAAIAMRRGSFSEAVQAGLSRARALGVRLGRPARITPEEANRALLEHGGLRRAARALGVPLATFWRALRRVSEK